MLNHYLPIGEIVKPQGIKGEVKVNLATDNQEHFTQIATLYVKNGEQFLPVQVLSARIQAGAAYLLLAGTADRDAAEKLRGTLLFVAREDAAPLEDGKYYIADLIGSRVMDEEGRALGTLSDVTHPGRTDIFTIKTPQGGESMAPVVPGLLLSADVEKGEIVLCAQRYGEVAVLED